MNTYRILRNRIGRLLRGQNGSFLAVAALALALLLAAAGLAIDAGTLYVTKTQLKKAANAAALSAAQELTGREERVRQVAGDILRSHGEENSSVHISVIMGSRVNVRIGRQVPLSFGRLLGLDEAKVEANAVSEIVPMGSAAGAAPLGIDQSVPLVYGTEYKLKVGPAGGESGYYGILTLGGTGAQTYESNLLYGYPNELKVGDILPTETGNVAGKTQTAVQQLIDQCPYPSGYTEARDCRRILLVPVYEPYSYDSNQLKQVKITGFAYFYIKEPLSYKDTSITGMFIKRAGTGFTKPGAADKGAYAIRLTE